MPAKLTTLSQFSQHSNITSKRYITYRVSLCQTVRLHSIDCANPAINYSHLAIRIEPESAVLPWSATVVGVRLRERVRVMDFPLGPKPTAVGDHCLFQCLPFPYM